MAFNLGVYREQSLETWELMAPGSQDRREWLTKLTGPVSRWLVERADPQPGRRFGNTVPGRVTWVSRLRRASARAGA